jgi:hypothetical protein
MTGLLPGGPWPWWRGGPIGLWEARRGHEARRPAGWPAVWFGLCRAAINRLYLPGLSQCTAMHCNGRSAALPLRNCCVLETPLPLDIFHPSTIDPSDSEAPAAAARLLTPSSPPAASCRRFTFPAPLLPLLPPPRESIHRVLSMVAHTAPLSAPGNGGPHCTRQWWSTLHQAMVAHTAPLSVPGTAWQLSQHRTPAARLRRGPLVPYRTNQRGWGRFKIRIIFL